LHPGSGSQFALGIDGIAVHQYVQPVAELRDAPDRRHAGEHAAYRGEVRTFDLDDGCVDVARELLRFAFGRNAAAIEDRQPVAALGLVHVVRGHQDRGASADQREQVFPEIAAVLRIDRAGRLVQQQQFRVVQRGGGEREALALPAGKGPGAAPCEGPEVVSADPLLDAPAARRPVEPIDPAHEVEVFVDSQVIPQREALCHIAELAAHRLRLARHRMTEHRRRAARRHQQPAQHADRGRLAGAVRTEKAVDLRARHVEVDPVHRDHRAEVARQSARRNRDRHDPARLTSSVTSTGMPVGSTAASGSVSTTSARKDNRLRSRSFSA
jgi:hypothetical protein